MKNSLTKKYMQDFLTNILNNYPHIRNTNIGISISDYPSIVIDEILKYYKEEDFHIYRDFELVKVNDIYKTSIKNSTIIFELNFFQENNKDMGVYLYISMSNDCPSIKMEIYGNNVSEVSCNLNILDVSEIVKAFVEINKSISTVVERAVLEEGKIRKKAELLCATIKAFIKKEIGNSVLIDGSMEDYKLLEVTVSKNSQEKIYIKINTEKVNDDVNVILSNIKDLLKLSDCDWLEFRHKKL